MTEPVQVGPRHVREVHVMGPSVQDPERKDFHVAEVAWFRNTAGEVVVEISLPDGGFASGAGADVCSTLVGLRVNLWDHGWSLIINAARRDVWGPTEQHPCGIDEVRIYPSLDAPPEPKPIDALARPADLSVFHSGSPLEQSMWYWEWAGEIGPGRLSWTEYTKLARQRGEAEASSQVLEPQLSNTDTIDVCAPRSASPQQREIQQALAEWGRREDGGVHLRLSGPFSTVGADGPDLFTALLELRKGLERKGWRFFVNASRFGAWSGTPGNPCGLAHVRIYPSLTEPPLNGQLDALGTPPGHLRDVDWAGANEQAAWYHEWAGTTPPGQPTWSELERRRLARRSAQ